MRAYRFYKDENGWFIDLKNFPFNKAWLAMIAGADTLLDKLAEGKDEVTLQIDTAPFPYTDGCLEKEYSRLTAGGVYDSKYVDIGQTAMGNNKVWLCPATLWVFLKYPKKIYYKVDRTKVEDKERVSIWNSLFGLPNSNQEMSFA